MRARLNPRIETQAQQVLRKTNCQQLPVPVELVAHHLGLRVEPAELGEDVSGVLVLGDGGGTIGYNAAHASVRQRFSIAHEIGHFTLHRETGQLFIDKQYTVYLRDQRSSSGEDLQEIQANQFAAALLMPDVMVRGAIVGIDFDLGDETALDALAEKFQVSRQAMTFRLANLKIF